MLDVSAVTDRRYSTGAEHFFGRDQDQEQDFPQCDAHRARVATGIEAAFFEVMRMIRLSGREATVVRAIGFAEPVVGAEIQDTTRMELEDVGDILNGLIAAGFVETIPYSEHVELAEIPVTSFEVNAGYARQLRDALRQR